MSAVAALALALVLATALAAENAGGSIMFTGTYTTSVSDCLGLPLALTVAQGYGLAEEIWNSEALLSGERVEATVEVAPDGAVSLLQLKPIQYSCGKECELYTKLPVRDRALLYLLDLSTCGANADMQAAMSVEEAKRLMWRSPGDSAATNMEDYIDTCSYGKRQWRPDDTAVVGPVRMPCTGALSSAARDHWPPHVTAAANATWGGLSAAASQALRQNTTHAGWWDLAQWCSAAEMFAIKRFAEEFAQQLVGATDPNAGSLEDAGGSTNANRTDGAELGRLRQILTWSGPRRSVFVLPPGSACAQAWAGLAQTSCNGVTCSIFVNGGEMAAAAGAGSSNGVRLLLHEHLHTAGALHANRGVVLAGDETDVMGACLVSGSSSSGNSGSSSAGLLCPAAPNAYRLGWATPLNTPGTPRFTPGDYGSWGNLTAGNFSGTPSNEIRGLVIPAAGTRDDNMLVVNLGTMSPLPNSARIPAPTYFISYRVRNGTRGGFDSGLPEQYSHALLIHTGPVDVNRRIHGFDINLIAWAPVYDSSRRQALLPYTWVSGFQPMQGDLGGAIQVRVVRASDTEVEVQLCRAFERVETTCADGLDGDCNGYADEVDPACQ
ncbi:hypothetical protein HXX76_005752 [Chlamydomonas incerta]|uniref:Peptidase M11 gametolysin domain-containing protein n=1 Tax=Chlamydomonas incerta TaxID=51695 RepID=A0A835T3L0_CHLIN|nr:hypothetical protein HXX76_005752 [Chlamydomonas incerta]|eukprot:KAG2438143.1 hypothetical protein HXX76_005752 [Chlamydomonas incerta]